MQLSKETFLTVFEALMGEKDYITRDDLTKLADVAEAIQRDVQLPSFQRKPGRPRREENAAAG